jgi:hypothetical protein
MWYDANSCDRPSEVSMSGNLAAADHRRRRVDLDNQQTAGGPRRSRPRGCAPSPGPAARLSASARSRGRRSRRCVVLVSFDACQVNSRMRTAGPRSDPTDMLDEDVTT